MASVDINLSLKDSAGTVKARTKDVQDLNKELTKTQQLSTGTKSGSRAVKASYMAATGGEGAEYGRARGSMGATGASGRDFANQAQGLGGLVRLYATYAANVFAVSAAFQALRESMNTDIMIRGMDQLGAASGVALGGLAKQFAAASDGAISFREAAEATTKAMSSGLSTAQFLELGKVAKGASQALGVGMSDAVSRLTRGITKLEPELLDELGIFTKVGKATEDYAKSVGKVESQLTDFERRQAFANAVLAEGAQKFGKIAGEANPYDKLLASFKDTAQQILSVVNSVISPIAKLLANNTELISVAIGVAALKITQQALPALLSWQAGLAKSAQEASKRAQEINTSFGEAFVERQAAKFKLPDIQAEAERVKKELASIDKEFEKVQAYKRPKQSGVLKSIQEDRLLSTRELANAEKEVSKYSERTDAASQKHAEILAKKIALQKELVGIQKQESDTQDKIVDVSTERSKLLSGEWQREQIVMQERAKAARLNLVQGVGTRVQEQGFIGGLGGFYKEVDSNKDLGRLDKLRTKAVGTFAGMATAAGILGRSLSSALIYLEVAVAVFGVLNMVFSKNGKQVDEFKSSVDALNESTKTASNVNKEYQSTLSIESINARANAFSGIADSIKTVTTNLIQADASASWLDKFVDGWKTLWGGDLKSLFDTSLADSIIGAIDALPEGEMREKLEAKLKATTGAVNLSRAGILDAFSKLGPSATKAVGLKVQEDLKAAKAVLVQSQAITQDLKTTGKAVNDAFTALRTGVSDKAPITSYLNASLKQAINLKKALEDTATAQTTLASIGKGEITTEFLTAESGLQLAPLVKEAVALNQQAEKYTSNLNNAKSKLREVNDGIAEIRKFWGDVFKFDDRKTLDKAAQDYQGIIDYSKKGLADIAANVTKLAQEAKNLLQKSIVEQINLGTEQLRVKLAQISNQSQQTILSQLPVKTTESISALAELERNALSLEQQSLNVQQRLITSIDRLRLSIEVESDKRDVEKLKAMSSVAGGREKVELDREIALRERRIGANTQAIAAYDTRNINTLQELVKTDPTLKPLLDSIQGIIISQKQYASRLNEINLKEELAKIGLTYERAVERSQSTIFELTEKGKAITGTTAEDMSKRAELERQIREEQKSQEGLLGTKNLAITDTVAKYLKLPTGEQVIASQKSEIDRVTKLKVEQKGVANAVADTIASQNISLKTLQETNAVAVANRSVLETNAKLEDESARASLNYAKEEIAFMERMGTLSGDEARAQLTSISLQEALIGRTEKLRAATEAKTQAEEKYNEDVKANGDKTNAVLDAQKKAYEATYTASVEGANRAYDAQASLLKLQNQLSDRQTAYADLFKQAFKSMEDAIVEFTRTGKLSFSSMIESFLEGLLRFEIQQQQMALYKGMGGFGGMANLLIDFTKYGPSMGNTGSMTGTGSLASAKGTAWDYGVQAFAKGSAFTNSIVDSPTLFKFARGTGLMGEAGPEAIMPLTRDGSGNLGVRAQGGGANVDVVVNNYGSEKATTKETTDSRGNRRIEVVIGDMVAQEVSRTGSATQNAFSSTYGTRPALARR